MMVKLLHRLRIRKARIMLLKVQDGFYLNSNHIIAVHIAKTMYGNFEITLEYTPNSGQSTGIFKKTVDHQFEAESFLEDLHRALK